MFMFNSNEPIKAHLQKLANQQMLNSAFVIEMIILLAKARKALVVW